MAKKETASAVIEAEAEATETAAIEPQPAAQPEPVETTAPVKRGRGRPPKAANGAASEIPSDAQPVAKRGRPPSKSKGLSAEAQANLAKQIQGLHYIAASATGLGELQISDAEAAMLADGIAAVSREYGLSIDGKTGAALQLLAAAAIVYTPRLRAINARRAQPAVQDNGAVHAAAPSIN